MSVWAWTCLCTFPVHYVFFPHAAMSSCNPSTSWVNNAPEILDLPDWFRKWMSRLEAAVSWNMVAVFVQHDVEKIPVFFTGVLWVHPDFVANIGLFVLESGAVKGFHQPLTLKNPKTQLNQKTVCYGKKHIMDKKHCPYGFPDMYSCQCWFPKDKLVLDQGVQGSHPCFR